MTRTQTMVQLNDKLVAQLDIEAERRHVSRSSIIREAITQYFEANAEAERVRSYIAGYTEHPPHTPDQWGDIEVQSDRAGKELAQRLDAEAEAEGLPW